MTTFTWVLIVVLWLGLGLLAAGWINAFTRKHYGKDEPWVKMVLALLIGPLALGGALVMAACEDLCGWQLPTLKSIKSGRNRWWGGVTIND